MENLRCHIYSIQSSHPVGIKKKNICTHVEAKVSISCIQSISFTPLSFLRRDFYFYHDILRLMSPGNQQIEGLDEIHMKHRGLLNKHLCEKKIQISPLRQKKNVISTFPI